MECARCGKLIYQTKHLEWRHYPYNGGYPHKARPEEPKNVAQKKLSDEFYKGDE